MITLLAFIFTIGILVTVHEYGHFQVAKWCNVRVLKFSIGFGLPLWRRKAGRDQTEFIIAAIPLGGYVKMLDEREFDEANLPTGYSEVDLKRAFNRQSVFKRIAIVLAGPLANLLLAVLIYWGILLMGISGLKPIIGSVSESSPAAIAGFKSNETIQKINGKQVDSWQEASWAFLNESLKSKSVFVEVLNDNNARLVHELSLAPIDFDKANLDVLNVLGFTAAQPEIAAQISEVENGSAAELAGFEAGDLVLRVNHEKVIFWHHFTQMIRDNPLKPLQVVVQRNTQEFNLTVTPEAKIISGNEIGMIGVKAKESKIHYTPLAAFVKANNTTWDTSLLSLRLMGKLVTGQLSLKNMSGPVTIANAAGESANRGIKQFIGFLAFISISIGIMNLLPIPVLDGGHLMYYMVEIVTGKPVSEATMMIGQKIGILLLGLMMVIAFYNDITRLITG
ncbi:MAG TPA: RIP metalloprotease RseP [Methylotenera sp.]|jgi:regulator of sigma E protease|nr:RIP metalloprotease RseP [Methylotenera sp.]HPH08080.1 RIP metalloprotease RseP [Methylotenera sp.]HPM49484.1 RIP metalloprotease RseP [Methylotenera sp.]